MQNESGSKILDVDISPALACLRNLQQKVDRGSAWVKLKGKHLGHPHYILPCSSQVEASDMFFLVHADVFLIDCDSHVKKNMIFMFFSMIHRIGWWENLQENPIFDGKNHGFL